MAGFVEIPLLKRRSFIRSEPEPFIILVSRSSAIGSDTSAPD